MSSADLVGQKLSRAVTTSDADAALGAEATGNVAKVLRLVPGRHYGFAEYGSETVMFHRNQQGYLDDGVFAGFPQDAYREFPKKGAYILLLQIVQGRQGRPKAEQWVLFDVQPKVPDLEIVPPLVPDTPATITETEPIDENQWLSVVFRKLRPNHSTSYAQHETLGQIAVPQKVIQAARIKGSAPSDRFEVRCRPQPGERQLAAFAIRRT